MFFVFVLFFFFSRGFSSGRILFERFFFQMIFLKQVLSICFPFQLFLFFKIFLESVFIGFSQKVFLFHSFFFSFCIDVFFFQNLSMFFSTVLCPLGFFVEKFTVVFFQKIF